MTILLLNFGYFIQALGASEKLIQTKSQTAQQLYEELHQQYNFQYSQTQCQIAINDTLVSWATPLKENDKVAFLSPFSGG